jgi:hypothetical protein
MLLGEQDCVSYRREVAALKHSTHRAVVVPLNAVRAYAGVDAHSIIVHVVPHQLNAAVVQADGQHRAVGLG